jgi:AcrR family transcriptional regulator
MGVTERRERERQEIKAKILEAARELFAEQGYEQVTMRRIAERIEYSPTAIYFHFKDKEALLRELCDQDFAALASQLLQIAIERDPIERLRRIGRAYVRFALDYPNQYRFMFMTPKPALDPCDSAIERGNPEQDAYAFLKATVSEAIQSNRLREGLSNPDLVSQMIWGATHGVVSLPIAKSNDPWVDWADTETTANEVIEALIRGLAREK